MNLPLELLAVFVNQVQLLLPYSGSSYISFIKTVKVNSVLSYNAKASLL